MNLPVYEGLKEYVLANLDEERRSLFDTAVSKYGYKSEYESFRKYVNKQKRKAELRAGARLENILPEIGGADEGPAEKLLRLLKASPTTELIEACNTLGCIPRDLIKIVDELRQEGFEIILDNHHLALGKKIWADIDTDFGPFNESEIVFGIASDLHFGSDACQITAMHEFAHIARKEGVKQMFCPGDIFAGHNVYKGQWREQYAKGSDEQTASAIINLPQGFEWYMLGGNHDYSFLSAAGHNPLRVLEAKREDVHYVGFDEKDIALLPGVDMRMWHPSGANPYSLSHKMQKGVEQLHLEEMRNIVNNIKDKPTLRFFAVGHLHVQMQVLLGSVLGFQAGCFEGTTNYLKRKSLHPAIGGWIIKATLNNENGFLKNFETKFHLFEEADKDYTHYRHTLLEGMDNINKPVLSPVNTETAKEKKKAV